MEAQHAAPAQSTSEPSALAPIAGASISVVLTASSICPAAAEVVSAWREYLASLNREFQILIAGPESSVNLLALREAGLQDDSHCQILTYADPEGDGPALRTALAAARHPLIVTAPCDKQYQPKELERFLGIINEVHLASGYRVYQPVSAWLAWVDLGKRILSRILLGYWPPPRECWLGARGWGRRAVARWIFGLRLQDVECRFRLFRREILDQFPIQSRGDFTQIEVLAKANHLGCVMAEIPVSWAPPPQIPRDATFAADAKLVFHDAVFRDPTAKPAEEKVEPLTPEAG